VKKHQEMDKANLLWTPDDGVKNNAEVTDFAKFLNLRTGFDWDNDFQQLWSYSVNNIEQFWDTLWDWHKIIGTRGDTIVADADKMPGARFFPDATLNFAENLLRNADTRPAITAYGEDGRCETISRAALKEKALRLAGWMRAQGVGPGDRVAAYIPNIPEAVITMLAAASIGAIYSSCSPDFGLNGVKDRFGQIEPKLLITVDGYIYGGKALDRRAIVADLCKSIPSIEAVLVKSYLDETPDISNIQNSLDFDKAVAHPPLAEFVQMPFNAPLYILYSSGTTGAPKCIVHGAGGTLLQHVKEHRLHSNVKSGDTIFYFTTCGWMMWNWLVSGLATEAHIVLYEGNPFTPGPETLWKIAGEQQISLFGTSAKYIDAVRKSGVKPGDVSDLSALRTICSTGSPLSTDGFAFVYDAIKSDVQLASISGGTDIVSCFVLGSPIQAVYAGEIQSAGLGMDVAILDDEGQAITEQQGELCCLKPFPAMPIGFWQDVDGSRYHNAYFNTYPNIWRHGDWATRTKTGGIIIHGRSDATLNPGGVRIGTAEIYKPVEAFDEIAEALVIGQSITDDVRIILFVRMQTGAELTKTLKQNIKSAIRAQATPRHVPSIILAVADIPRTRSGKITELAVRDVIHGRPVKNTEALANPEALEHFRDLPDLQV